MPQEAPVREQSQQQDHRECDHQDCDQFGADLFGPRLKRLQATEVQGDPCVKQGRVGEFWLHFDPCNNALTRYDRARYAWQP